jgi:hypothetical protein
MTAPRGDKPSPHNQASYRVRFEWVNRVSVIWPLVLTPWWW